MRFRCLIPFLLLVLCTGPSVADDGEKPLRIFGYFQNSLQRWTDFEDHRAQVFFNLQQLNLLFQKDLSHSWAAFLNFEFLNNYSSQQRWGSARRGVGPIPAKREVQPEARTTDPDLQQPE